MDCIRTLQLTGSQVTQHHIIVRTGLTSSHCPAFRQQTFPLQPASFLFLTDQINK
jgi:hypothetical protein